MFPEMDTNVMKYAAFTDAVHCMAGSYYDYALTTNA